MNLPDRYSVHGKRTSSSIRKFFLKVFGLALLIQILFFALCPFFSSLRSIASNGYWVWIVLAINLSGAKGEATMMWPPICGLILGVLVYSLFAAVLFSAVRVLREYATLR